MTTITNEIQSLAPSALVEMFIIDATLQGGPVMHFHPGVNLQCGDLVWQGVTYTRYPVEFKGASKRGTGTIPRPTITASNIQGILASEAKQYSDFAGCKLTRKRTFARFLDAVNFPGSSNPTADPNQYLPDEVWFFDRKSGEDPQQISFELAAAFDVAGVMLPRRQFIQNACTWVYRGADCGFTGGAVADEFGVPTTILANDACGKRLTDCQLRFGAQAILPYGGFPACGLIHQ